jgi:hypothetical protein
MAEELPIGRASNIHVEGNRLVGDVEFASAELYPYGRVVPIRRRAGDGGIRMAERCPPTGAHLHAE